MQQITNLNDIIENPKNNYKSINVYGFVEPITSVCLEHVYLITV